MRANRCGIQLATLCDRVLSPEPSESGGLLHKAKSLDPVPTRNTEMPHGSIGRPPTRGSQARAAIWFEK
jgi:hypothetical protein